MFGQKQTNGTAETPKSGMAMLAESALRSMMGAEQMKELFSFFQGMKEWAERMEKKTDKIDLSLNNLSDRIGRLENAAKLPPIGSDAANLGE